MVRKVVFIGRDHAYLNYGQTGTSDIDTNIDMNITHVWFIPDNCLNPNGCLFVKVEDIFF